MGHGKPGKSWNFVISFSRHEKSCILIVGHCKSLKKLCLWRIKNQ